MGTYYNETKEKAIKEMIKILNELAYEEEREYEGEGYTLLRQEEGEYMGIEHNWVAIKEEESQPLIFRAMHQTMKQTNNALQMAQIKIDALKKAINK